MGPRAVLFVIGLAAFATHGVSAMQHPSAVTAAGYVYVSTITPANAGDDSAIAAQTADVLAQLKAVLEANGSSLGQLCTINVQLRSAADFAAMNDAYRAVFSGAGAPTRTTIVAGLPRGVLVEMSAVAVPNGARREVLQPPKWAKNPRPYNYIVKTDDLVFLSGLTARRTSDDTPVSGPVRTQLATIMDNADTLLATAGVTFDDVVAARIYLTSPYDFQEMNETYGDYFDKEPPARATAVVDLMSPDTSVEVTLLASQQPKQSVGGPAGAGLPLSLAVQAGPRVWFSGVIGDTDKHPGDIAAQTRDVFDRLKPTMARAGVSFADVVDTTVYLRDTSAWAAVDAVCKDVFPLNPPARTATGARLVVEPGLVEVLMTAVKR